MTPYGTDRHATQRDRKRRHAIRGKHMRGYARSGVADIQQAIVKRAKESK